VFIGTTPRFLELQEVAILSQKQRPHLARARQNRICLNSRDLPDRTLPSAFVPLTLHIGAHRVATVMTFTVFLMSLVRSHLIARVQRE
jgi:hypothetical protein